MIAPVDGGIRALELPWEPASAAAARRMVRDALEDLAPDASSDAADLAVLLASELTSNAILHARTPFTVSVSRTDGIVRVSVRDGSRALPSRRRYSLTASTGRGVGLMQDCATRTGVDTDATGKTVWFEIDIAAHAGQEQVS